MKMFVEKFFQYDSLVELPVQSEEDMSLILSVDVLAN